jgi:amino acid adenylation domain-containing protein
LFEAQVERKPERTALRSGAKAVSYAELDSLANRIAQVLRSRGVGRGQRVGLCVERGADMVAAMLGILKAGAAYVPLDPAFPPERLRFMAEDAQLALLVSTTDLGGCFALSRERQLLLDTDVPALASPDQRLSPDAELDARPEDPAYVIYTSGSTGKPKGVVVPHRAVVNFLPSMAREPGLTADDVLVAVTTLSFDIAVLELQLPLTVGATVVIARRDEAIDGRALSALLEQHRATVMQATPVTWRLLLEAGWKGRKDFKALVGGEALPKDLAEQLIAQGVELWNMYGPTETTVWSTCAHITDTSNGITIGKPIANTTVYVLDAQKNPCPVGVPGELCIGGDGVTQGYWNRPELTAERFISDPFSATPGDTLYCTGDCARWRNDGTLEHLGRFDDQAKVRGFRIELGEIEAVLAEHPAVGQAAVHLWKVQANDVRIVACCVPANAGALAPVSLRKHMRARLPEYMVPQYFVPVHEIPLTPNGKIDRSKLPAPALAEVRSRQHEAPSDPIEATIAEIWTNLIGPARPIGRADKFFEMGGHSLLALQALRQMENKLGVRLEFRVLFQESLAEIATKCAPRAFSVGAATRKRL